MSLEQSVSLLKELTLAHGPSGGEGEVREIFQKELNGWGEFGQDALGSIYCHKGDGKKILIAGHLDEVGFRVQAITSQGFVKFVTVGGWWGHTLLAQKVVVKTRSGKKFLGVIGSKPLHYLSSAQRKSVRQIDDMYIDFGFSSRESAEQAGISIGDYIAPESSFEAIGEEGRYMSKAFDNRAGVAATIEVAKHLPEGLPHSQLILAATAQEELGVRGATTLANMVQPDYAIVLEGTPADDTLGFDLDTAQGKLSSGVQIRMHDPSTIMSPQLVSLATEVAEEEGIDYQLAVRTSGGTDARAFQQSSSGVPTIVLGTPARYIHTHNSIIQIEDYLAKVTLAVKLAERLDSLN